MLQAAKERQGTNKVILREVKILKENKVAKER
jgi:hypothetical protein